MLKPIPLYIRCVGLERPMTPSVWFDNWYWINILLFYLTSVFSMSLWRARQNKLENVPCSTFNEWRFTVSKETVVLIRWEIETRKFVLPNESFRFKFPPCENHDWQRATGRLNLQLVIFLRSLFAPVWTRLKYQISYQGLAYWKCDLLFSYIIFQWLIPAVRICQTHGWKKERKRTLC